MCLAIPGRVIEVQEDESGVLMGRTDFGGVVRRVCLAYAPEAKVGDYVLVHVGFALGVVDEEEAMKTLQALESLNQLDELQEEEKKGEEEAEAESLADISPGGGERT